MAKNKILKILLKKFFMKSKAVFIMPPSNYDFNKSRTPSWSVGRVPPIGLIAIASYLHAKGHDVKIIDCREIIVTHKTNDYYKLVLNIIDEFKPDMIGINMLTALFDEAKKISCEIKKKFPNSLIVAGGPHPSVEPELTLKQIPEIDAICIGPGEEVSLDILDGKEINRIPGLMHRNYVNKYEKRPLEMSLDKYPFPNYDLVNYRYYTEFSVNTIPGWGCKCLAVLTSRSCPYSCKFCASDWSKPLRWHSPEYVIEMVKYLSARYDMEVLLFVDDTISLNKDRLQKICEGFVKEKLFWPNTSLRWYAQMRANQIDLDTLKMMKKAGCFSVSIGIESGSDRILQIINKRTTVEMNKRACNCVKEAGLSLSSSFVIGIPGETEAEMRETFDFMKNVSVNTMGIGNFRPLPGSPFYNELVNKGSLSKENINWSSLGDFSILPDKLFCDVSIEKFKKIWNEAEEIAWGGRWTAIHEDTLLKHSKEIKAIASRTRVKIAKPDNYESSTQISYIPLSPYAVYNFLFFTMRNFIPVKLRAQVKTPIVKFKEILSRVLK